MLAMLAATGLASAAPAISPMNSPDFTISIAGEWRVRATAERATAGSGAPFQADAVVRLPGALAAQGVGEDIAVHTPWVGSIVDRAWFTAPEYARWREPGNIKVPFWLQPEKYFRGVARYEREVELPASWAGRRVVLALERAHWATRVWLDGREAGRDDSLSTPHEYDLGAGLAPGKHTLAIEVDNTVVVDVGPNSHSISDHTQGNWNGLIGRIELVATAPAWLDEVRVFPRVAARSALVRGRVGGAATLPAGAVARVRVERLACGTPRADMTGAEASPRPPQPRLKGIKNSKPHATPDGGLGAASPPAMPASLAGGAGALGHVAAIGKDGAFEVECPLGADAALWDEFSPALYRAVVSLENGEARAVTFGLREVGTEGTQITVNGRRVFLRGTLECAAWPLTGYPPTDVESWRRVLRAARAHGLNHIRFHSWCPPEAAFVAGDELGFYFQVEAASWPNQGTTVGDGGAQDAWLVREADRIVRAYGNHPSFMFFAAGNEPSGPHSAAWLAYWVERMKADPRRLHTCTAGWPEIAASQYHVRPRPRAHQMRDNLNSRLNARPPETRTDYRDYIGRRAVPVVSHEIGQWCVYPNFDEMPKYTGVMKPRNFEIFRETLARRGMAGQAREFLRASGKLQVLCYKEEIESALRTPGMGGFQLLGLGDFPGQGTALVGVLDAFWEEKGYVAPEEWRRFCADTVPLARLERRVFEAGDTLRADIELAHYGPATLEKAVVKWKLADGNGGAVAEGRLASPRAPSGALTALGRVEAALDASMLANGGAARKLTLVVSVEDEAAGARAENDWDVWLYPKNGAAVARTADDTRVADGVTTADGARATLRSSATAGRGSAATAANNTPATDGATTARHADGGPAPREGRVLVCDEFDGAAEVALREGGAVLLAIPPGRVRGDPKLGRVELGFTSIFWNTAWTGGKAPHTLGILCDPAHPALAGFPTESHSNWQWWYVVSRASAMILDELPPELRPVIQVVDDWFTNRKLALAFECRVGAGRLLVCSVDLREEDGANPVVRHLRASLLRYAAGADFAPQVELASEQVRALFTADASK
ncbi:MAG: hypothetical protein LBI02_07970 [Opitutaceae bacterium]|nr:hypothetical protein [Opitutaceae bacterium]